MKKKYLRILISFFILLLLWQILAIKVQNEIILPKPSTVWNTMCVQLQDPLFYTSIVFTLLRISLGLIIAFILAFFISLLAYFYPWFKDLFHPVLTLIRSIPNISYILIVLFWFGAQTSVIIISFLILFPTMYATIEQGLTDIPNEYHDLMKLFPAKKYTEIRCIYLPFLRPYIYTAILTGLSLAFKVGIMAEILGQSGTGIGRQLNICRLQLRMEGVFAWTIWIIVLLAIMEKGISIVKQKNLGNKQRIGNQR